MIEAKASDSITENDERAAVLASFKKVVPFAVRNLRGPYCSGLDPADPNDPARLYLLKFKGVRAKNAAERDSSE